MNRQQQPLETPARNTRSSGPPAPHEPLNTSRNKKTQQTTIVQVSTLIPTFVDLHIAPPVLTPVQPLEERQEDTEPRLPPTLQPQVSTMTDEAVQQKIQEILDNGNEKARQQNEEDRKIRERDLREMNQLKADMDKLNREEERRRQKHNDDAVSKLTDLITHKSEDFDLFRKPESFGQPEIGYESSVFFKDFEEWCQPGGPTGQKH